MGKRTTASREGLYGLRGPRDNPDPALARGLAEEQAKNAGILGVLKQPESQGNGTPSIFGRDTAFGNDADVLGGLIGNQTGEAYGVGGLGLVGTGSGGGVTAEGSIGLGNLGTIGKGGGGNGSGYGRGAGGLGGKRAKAPDVIPGQANVRGSLDKEIIRRIIARHINEVRYCYEQELTKKPDLGGRVMVQFTIAASGQVIASVLQNSTMGNARVENCTVQAVRRWEFPKPLGGGIVIVSYPFVMTPGGGPHVAIGAPNAPPPPRPIDEALATLAKGGGSTQIERISALLGLRKLSSAEALAWTIDRRAGGFEVKLLVARLLELTDHHRDAVRVLSEAAASAPQAVAAELRTLKSDADADEVARLASR
jgi:TonB family protein